MTKRFMELLNDYATACDSDFGYVDYDPEIQSIEVLNDGKVAYLWIETIFSLRFWFIDWLFENELIDVDKCMEDEDFKFLSKHYEPQDAALMVLATRYSNVDLFLSWLKWAEKE